MKKIDEVREYTIIRSNLTCKEVAVRMREAQKYTLNKLSDIIKQDGKYQIKMETTFMPDEGDTSGIDIKIDIWEIEENEE